MKTFILSILFFLFLSGVHAQTGLKDDADPDVSSVENITVAVLQSISGEKGEKRDWQRFRKLFWPTAQLNAIFHKGDSIWIKINTIDEFVSLAGTWYEDNGFKEYQIKSKKEAFGNIAHVFQSYGATWAEGTEVERGVNSFQLVFLQNRWWIINLIWDIETEKNRLPKALQR